MERKRSVRRRQKPPFGERAKESCRQFTAFLFSNVGIIILVVLYTIAGSFMFTAIEGQYVEERAAILNKTLLATRLWEIACCKTNVFNKTLFDELVGAEIKIHQDNLVQTARKGFQGEIDGEDQWTFAGSFLYSLTVITTIGYGNLSPRTLWGKLATIVYAIIGMPLFLLYLSNIGDILAKSFKWIYAKFFLCRVCPGVAKRRALREKRKRAMTEEPDYPNEFYDGMNGGMAFDNLTISTQNVDDDSDTDIDIPQNTQTVTVPLTVCISIMIGYMLFGASMFSEWEDWNYLDGSYFCFISLSSIGFGDIVPGLSLKNNDKGSLVDISFILCAVYLLLGMALIAMCFNLMQEQVIHKIQSLKNCLRRCFQCNNNNNNSS